MDVLKNYLGSKWKSLVFISNADFDSYVCTGQSGLGKSTLMNTLFKSKVSRKSVLGTAEEKIPKTIEIKSISHGKNAQIQHDHVSVFHSFIIVNSNSLSSAARM